MPIKDKKNISDERRDINNHWVKLTNAESSKQQQEKPPRLFRKTAKKNLISTRDS